MNDNAPTLTLNEQQMIRQQLAMCKTLLLEQLALGPVVI